MLASLLRRLFGFESLLVRRMELRQRFRPRLLRLEGRDAPTVNPVGGEFRVNGHTTDNQNFPAIAADLVSSGELARARI